MDRRVAPALPDPAELLTRSTPQRFAAAFLIACAGTDHAAAAAARLVLDEDDDLARFFRAELDLIRTELAAHTDLLPALEAAAHLERIDDADEAFDRVWSVLFPEGVGALSGWNAAVARLRKKRTIRITQVNPDPIVDPVQQVLFTSNVLVSPGDGAGPADYWFDHPIPLDAAPEDTELAYGLRQLDQAIGYELERHPEWQGPASVALSVSATHRGYETAGRELVGRVVQAIGPLPRLRIYAFEETRTRSIWQQLCGDADSDPVFGVAGLYGRHYSFLKAIAALWSVLFGGIKATFKIDLDQVFPQEQLVAETGRSALEHLTTDRWGAAAVSSTGEKLDLALIAGGLVNQSDIAAGLFTPDVTPGEPSAAEDAVFYSRLPQAVSTTAEIMSANDAPLERIHVTGGTNGILVSGLRRWRLFTPSVFGRAEDQAYLISGLGAAARPAYLHAPGLIMRHDKADLIPEVIARSASSKHIGDLVRTRLFSVYGAPHKELLDPFTGCFVSRIPHTVTTLRLCLRALALDAGDVPAYLSEAAARLRAADALAGRLDEVVTSERAEWAAFYDSLDGLERDLAAGHPHVAAKAEGLRRLIDGSSV